MSLADGKDIKVWDNHAQECRDSGRKKFTFGNHSHLWRMLHENIKVTKDIKVVDYGCGPGYWSNLFEDCSYHGLDQSPQMLNLASDLSPELPFHLINNSGMTPFLDASIGIVFTASVLQHNRLEDKDKIYKEFARILKPGGLYLCTENTFRPDNYNGVWSQDVTDGYTYTSTGWELLLNQYGFNLIEYIAPGEYLFQKRK